MQNSIKIENELFGERTFSGGVSTTLDERLGSEGDGSGASSTPYKLVKKSGSGLTNKQVFDLMKDNVVIFNHKDFLVGGFYYINDGNELIEFRAQLYEIGVEFIQKTNLPDEEFEIEIGALE
jgi:hypothetical protein